jgi:Amt family ammonium transporter
MLGVFATKAVNPAGADGLIAGSSTFFVHELLAVILACVYAFLFTYGMLALINIITKVRVSEEVEDAGLDSGIHGETAYDAGVL